jgi:hypothetical protein
MILWLREDSEIPTYLDGFYKLNNQLSQHLNNRFNLNDEDSITSIQRINIMYFLTYEY